MSGSRPWDGSTTALTAQWCLLHQVKTKSVHIGVFCPFISVSIHNISHVVSLAPCLPREVEAKVDCNSDGAAVVSWNATYGAANFSLTAIVSGSPQTLCATQQNRCNVTGLSCGETYNLSFTASNTQCSLTAQMHANLTTREHLQQILISGNC